MKNLSVNSVHRVYNYQNLDHVKQGMTEVVSIYMYVQAKY